MQPSFLPNLPDVLEELVTVLCETFVVVEFDIQDEMLPIIVGFLI